MQSKSKILFKILVELIEFFRNNIYIFFSIECTALSEMQPKN